MSMPFEPDPEAMEQMREHYERTQMAVDSFHHSFYRLINQELDEEQLITIKTMLQVLTDTSESQLAAQWHGIVLATLHSRFKLCMRCGTDHDKDLEEATRSPEEKVTREPQEFSERERKSDGTIPFLPRERELMDQYHIDDQYEEGEPPIFVGFACTGIEGMKQGCGWIYPTLEDRMLKEPENCSGCHQRMMHG